MVKKMQMKKMVMDTVEKIKKMLYHDLRTWLFINDIAYHSSIKRGELLWECIWIRAMRASDQI